MLKCLKTVVVEEDATINVAAEDVMAEVAVAEDAMTEKEVLETEVKDVAVEIRTLNPDVLGVIQTLVRTDQYVQILVQGLQDQDVLEDNFKKRLSEKVNFKQKCHIEHYRIQNIF